MTARPREALVPEELCVLGGSFDPPHLGHLLAGVTALAVTGAQRLLVVPVMKHVFDKPLSPFTDRVALARIAFAPLQAAEVSELEAELPTPSVTLTLLRALSARHPGTRLRLVVGSDVLGETERWHAWEEVVALAPPVVLARAGHPHPAALPPVLPEVSSSELRAWLRQRRAGNTVPALERWLGKAVLGAIEARGLYLD